MEARILYRGRTWTIYLLAEGTREYAREFVSTELTKEQQTQIRRLLRRAADHGLPESPSQFRRLHGHPNLAEFKRFQVRLMCFFDGPSRIVLTHGFKKKTDATDPEQIKRALRMREAYLQEKTDHEG
jgi:mRNA-degrading endonuclease RelE of RelBE toxin-antitoxin system